MRNLYWELQAIIDGLEEVRQRKMMTRLEEGVLDLLHGLNAELRSLIPYEVR